MPVAETVCASMALLLYALASFLAVMHVARGLQAPDWRSLGLAAAGALPLIVVLILHGRQAGGLPVFCRFDALACYGVALTAAYVHMVAVHRTPGIGAILIPCVTVVLLGAVPAVHAAPASGPQVSAFWLGLHVVSAFVGYAFFSLAGLLAVAYLVQDHNFKHKRFGVVWEGLPALETLDHLMGRQVGFGFLVFTISIGAGLVVVRLSGGGEEWLRDPKVVATVATWGLYAVLVHMRASADRHGRRVAAVTVAGLLCVLFVFLGVHFVAPSAHGFLMFKAAGAGL